MYFENLTPSSTSTVISRPKVLFCIMFAVAANNTVYFRSVY